jgi:hypothetical protein
MTITLEQQIAALRRELALRRNVYRKRVREGRMSLELATTEYCNMLAILLTLTAVSRRDYEGLDVGIHITHPDTVRELFA